MRAALLVVASDLPAIRKITQFLGHKADLGCSRCKFRAEREAGTVGASGKMSYFTTNTAESRTHEEVALQANQFLQANNKTDAAKVAKENGVRYTELVRLPYFDLIRMVSIDPMHTVHLGMVRKETELILSTLAPTKKDEFIRRVKSLKLPYDLGRLPTNMFDSTGLSGVTAAQWKTFAIVYARPCLYKLLAPEPYKCLVLLAKIVEMISSPVYILEDIPKLYRLITDHHQLFRKVYGKWAVSVNYHMCLHIPDIVMDLGPPQTFWCYPYERMNGMLAGTPNSRRCVEVEVLDRFLREFTFSTIDLPKVDPALVPNSLKGFADIPELEDELPPYPTTAYVLSLLNCSPENHFSTQQEIDRGEVKDWPVKLLFPSKTVRLTPSFYKELASFFDGLYGDSLHYVQPRIRKYGRCCVNGQYFSSNFNSTERGSVVKAMFAEEDNEIAPYFGKVSFYFTVNVVVNNESKPHILSYVHWFKFRCKDVEPQSRLYMVSKQVYMRDRIVSPRRFLCRCVLVSTKSQEPYYFVSELPK
ncbi:hypothetical protein SPONN_2357 [uncultured Candidatus Thioglobus sp.]|nr:hypothetical protein SPONN_2357 [uncultured Candidatus Thioglobus sp.]